MKVTKYLIALIIVTAPFLFSGPKEVNHQIFVDGWTRVDLPCTGFYWCEKTKCTSHGAELCDPQYCNFTYCGSEPPKK